MLLVDFTKLTASRNVLNNRQPYNRLRIRRYKYNYGTLASLKQE